MKERDIKRKRRSPSVLYRNVEKGQEELVSIRLESVGGDQPLTKSTGVINWFATAHDKLLKRGSNHANELN